MRIGIDIGGSHIGIGIVNSSGEIIYKIEKDYDKKEKDMSQIVIQTIKELVENCLKEVDISRIESIGMAFPGIVSNGIVIKAENLGIEKLNIVEELKKYFNIPIHLENDAKCAAIAEKKYGSLKDYSDSLFLIVGTGVGGAVFLDGKLLRPKKHAAFELGHMVIKEDGIKCNCGRNGCFEVYASMRRLKEKIKDEFNLDNIDGKQIKEFMIKNKGNDRLNKILDIYMKDLVVGLLNLINVFEPEVISIGGSFAYYKEVLLEALEKKLEEVYRLYNKTGIPKIVLAEMKNDAGIIGAAML